MLGLRGAWPWRNALRLLRSVLFYKILITCCCIILLTHWNQVLLCTTQSCQIYLGPRVLTRFELNRDAMVLDWKNALQPATINYDKLNLEEIAKLYPDVLPGGSWAPKQEPASSRTAIIVPYRNRTTHLHVFLRHMHSYLQNNGIHYTIFIVHQIDNQAFNRAKLMNVGFIEAQKESIFDCNVFHDVDLLPVVSGVPYNCSIIGPLHMIAAMDKENWGLLYDLYFGGVTAFTDLQLKKMNGFSNNYWGWGGEDDDAWNRVTFSDQTAVRLPPELGRYSMAKHSHDNSSENPIRYEQLTVSQKIWQKDGLNSLNYKLLSVTKHSLYTELYVNLLEGVVDT